MRNINKIWYKVDKSKCNDSQVFYKWMITGDELIIYNFDIYLRYINNDIIYNFDMSLRYFIN